MANKLKIGQEITILEDFELITLVGNRKLKVKEGDTAVVTKSGTVMFLKGDAKGIFYRLNAVELDGYDYDNMANMIYKRLKNYFRMGDFLTEYEINEDNFKDVVSDVLGGTLRRGIDVGVVAKRVYTGLNTEFDIVVFLEEEEIDKQRFISEIEDVLYDIL